MKMRQYVIQKVTDSVHEAIENKFPISIQRSWNSPRQGWLRGLTYIGVLDPERSIAAYELWQRALQIAERRRDEKELRSLSAIDAKRSQEEREFDEVIKEYRNGQCSLMEAINRLANLLYYAVQAYVLSGNLDGFNHDCEQYCSQIDIPQDIAFHCAVAKYRDRAGRDTKDIQAEYKAIQAEYKAMQRVLDEFENCQENLLT